MEGEKKEGYKCNKYTKGREHGRRGRERRERERAGIMEECGVEIGPWT